MNAVINLYKPGGMTSHDAVTKVRRALGIKKVGHAGTLDPMATGVLLVCVGECTKLSNYMMDLGKEYEASLKFGERTDTLDAEGEVVERVEGVIVSAADAACALEGFRGRIMQRPPMYSAIKQGGTPLYKLARKGVEVEREEREVEIYEIRMLEFDFPFMKIGVACSKGTYIRTLVDDIGVALGTLAHMTALERTRVGGFRASDAARMEDLGPDITRGVVDADAALSHLQQVVLNEDDYARARNGGNILATKYGFFIEKDNIRLKGPKSNLFAIGRIIDSTIKINRILHLSE